MKENKKLLETLYAQWHNGVKISWEAPNQVYGIHSEDDTDYSRMIYPLRTLEFTLTEPSPINWKFHLFPLPMLTKPIRIEGYNGGKEFVPAKELFKGFENLRLNTFVDKDYNLWATYTILEDEVFTIPIIGAKGIKDVDHWIVEQLHEWHFNVFNLDESEFIDASISKCYEPK